MDYTCHIFAPKCLPQPDRIERIFTLVLKNAQHCNPHEKLDAGPTLTESIERKPFGGHPPG